MIPRGLMVAGCHLRLARRTLSPPAGTLLSSRGCRVGTAVQKRPLLQAQDPGDVCELPPRPPSTDPPASVQSACHHEKKPLTGCSSSADPRDAGVAGSKGTRAKLLMVGPRETTTWDGRREADDVLVVACAGDGGPFPFVGGARGAKDAGFVPQAQERCLSDPVPGQDDFRDAAWVRGGGSSPHAGLAGGKAELLKAQVRELSYGVPGPDAARVAAGGSFARRPGVSTSATDGELALAAQSLCLDSKLAGVAGRKDGSYSCASNIGDKIAVHSPEPEDGIRRPTLPSFKSPSRLSCPSSARRPQSIYGNYLQSRSHSSLPTLIAPFVISFGDTKLLEKQLKEDIDSLVVDSWDNLDALKSKYAKSIRPFFLSCGLIAAEGFLDHPDCNLIHEANSSLLSKTPNYVTCSDVMRKLETLSDENKRRLLNFLRDNRVMIVESWTTSLGSIEDCVFDLSGPHGDSHYYRGQSDASVPYKAKGKTISASLCFLIWKGNKIVDCHIFRNVHCSKSVRAELLAMYALTRQGVKLGIQKFSVITDCDDVNKNNRGLGEIKKNDENRELKITTRCLQRHYKSFISRLEPRAKNFLPDCILKEYQKHGQVQDVAMLLKKWEPYLSGQPIFRIQQDEKKIEAGIVKAFDEGFRKFGKDWKLELKSDDEKFESLMNLVRSLSPPLTFISVTDEHRAEKIIDSIKMILDCEITKLKSQSGWILSLSLPVKSGAKKFLNVLYDTQAETLVPDHIVKEMGPGWIGLNVTFVTPEDRKACKLPEISPICLLFFGKRDTRYYQWTSVVAPTSD